MSCFWARVLLRLYQVLSICLAFEEYAYWRIFETEILRLFLQRFDKITTVSANTTFKFGLYCYATFFSVVFLFFRLWTFWGQWKVTRTSPLVLRRPHRQSGTPLKAGNSPSSRWAIFYPHWHISLIALRMIPEQSLNMLKDIGSNSFPCH